MRITPDKGTSILERDFADAFKMINDNSYLSGLDASYSSSSLVFSVTAGAAIVAGHVITASATGDLSITLEPNRNRYIYLMLRTGNSGLNALEARLVAREEMMQFSDGVLLYLVKTGLTGVTAVSDLRVTSLDNRYAHAGSALPSPHEAVSLAAATERSVTGTTEVEVKRFQVQHEGTVTLVFDTKRSAGTGTINVYTTSGGETAVASTTTIKTTYETKTLTFAVKPGDIVTIKLKSSASNYVTYIKNAVIAYYLGIPAAPAELVI